MHVLLAGPGDAAYLLAEWRRSPGGAAMAATQVGEDVVVLDPGGDAEPGLPHLVFARQALLNTHEIASASIRGFADRIYEAVVTGLTPDAPWRMHVFPRYGASEEAGRHRCQLIGEALRDRMKRQRRHLLRRLETEPSRFRESDSLVQLVLTSPDQGFLSVNASPLPHRQRALLSPYPGGEIPVAVDHAAPSRAFAKLLEAELRLGRAIAAGEHCVDLGASPGSWSYVALRRGARVTAVDRSPLRADCQEHPRLEFHSGDAFRFEPTSTVDWLLCDVIAAPERSIELVIDWVKRRLCRAFVVTIKFKGTADYDRLDRLKTELPPLCEEWLLTRLCANKNEACAAGILAG